MSQSQKTMMRRLLRAHPGLSAVALGLLMAGCSGAANTDSQVQTPPEDTGMTSSQTDDGMMATAYQDGTYTATGNYTSPAGAEEVEVTVTIENDVVTDTQFVGKAQHPTSQKKQTDFSQGFSQEVVGKSIDEVSLTIVNGSSLAPKGFMDALSKIKAEAQA